MLVCLEQPLKACMYEYSACTCMSNAIYMYVQVLLYNFYIIVSVRVGVRVMVLQTEIKTFEIL